MNTQEQFVAALNICRELFVAKMHDYGTAWRILRSESLTDQLYIKAARIRSLETKGVAMVDEGIVPEFVGIVNYAIMGLIQLERGATDGSSPDFLQDPSVLESYDRYAQEALELMQRKNHDYDEAWRLMRVSSYTDLILMKIFRTKQIESHQGETLVSEGVAANYFDMLNYAIFALIKLVVGPDTHSATQTKAASKGR